MTPGIALAESVISDLDRNRDGSLSADERAAYGNLILGTIEIDVDGRPVDVQLGSATYPDFNAMRRGEGTIQLQLTATLQDLTAGAHQLAYRNRSHSDGSVYLANALVPESDRVAIAGQQRDSNQSELIINFVVRPPATRGHVWLLGGLVVSAALSVLLLRSSRSAR